MNERLKELAAQAGLNAKEIRENGSQTLYAFENFDLERFAELVRQDEREACAITAWSTGRDLYLKHHDIREVGSACATAIRARGEK